MEITLTGITTTAFTQNILASSNAGVMKSQMFTGTSAEYVRGDGATATLPVIPNLTSQLTNDSGFITSAPVTSVAGKTGSVALVKGDVGLGNVDNTADAVKSFGTSQVTSGTFADARIAQSNITQHQAALSIASSQVTGTKTSSFISDFTTAARNLISVTGNGSYNSSTGVITVNANNRTFNAPSRTLNNCYQISSTQDAMFSYVVDVSTSLSLTSGAEGAVTLTSYTNSSCTTGAVDIVSGSSAQTGALVVGLGINQKGPVALNGMAPSGRWIKIATTNTVGSPSFAIRAAQQEVLF